MTAFDGPGPFDGDAVSNYLDRTKLPPLAFREAVAHAFDEVIEGGAARRMPAEFLALVGRKAPIVYIDVDVYDRRLAPHQCQELGRHAPRCPAFDHLVKCVGDGLPEGKRR